jgi:hypothetical protein
MGAWMGAWAHPHFGRVSGGYSTNGISILVLAR